MGDLKMLPSFETHHIYIEKKQIEKEDKLFIAADKTSNHYKVDLDEYHELVEKNVHKEYKKENPQNVKNIDKAHIDVVNALELQDRVFKTTDRTCFITMKDHKEGFQNSPTSRLLNPRKCEIGKISHQILSKLVTTVKNETNLNQFKNVYSCINWFKNLKEKPNLKFIVFDIVNFYPSITQELLEQALNWA